MFGHGFVFELKCGIDSIIFGLRMPTFHNDSFSQWYEGEHFFMVKAGTNFELMIC